MHGPPFGPWYPGRQTQSKTFDLACSKTVPEFSGHGTTASAYVPTAILYVSTGTPTHGPPLGPTYPALQMQSVRAETADLPMVPLFGGHVTQSAPTLCQYRACRSALVGR